MPRQCQLEEQKATVTTESEQEHEVVVSDHNSDSE